MEDTICRQQALALRFTKAINEDGVIYVPLGEYLSGIESLPPAQPTQTNADPMQGSALDCVRRQQAIDTVNAATVITNPEHFKGHEKFTGFMEDEDISSFGKWERANGFNAALVETRILLGKLPFAQPEARWIPCGEKLPEENLPVLVAVKQKDRLPKWVKEQTYSYVTDIDVYDDGDFDTYKNKVAAWMPLPEPWGGESE